MRVLVGALLLVAAAPGIAAVPIGIAPSGHATVPVVSSLGIHEFVFDTGAEGSAVYEQFSRGHGLQRIGAESLQGQTGASGAELVKLPPLSVDGHRKARVQAIVLPPRSDEVPLAGIIGLDVFGDSTVDFDLKAKRLSIRPSGNRLPGGRGQPVAARPTTGGLLTVPVRVNGVWATAVIDTGARKTRINWKLGTLLGLRREDLAAGDTIAGATNQNIETSAANVRRVEVGGRTLRHLPALVADLAVFETFGVADRPAVILGMDWLADTRLIIDFPRRRVWFVPSVAGK